MRQWQTNCLEKRNWMSQHLISQRQLPIYNEPVRCTQTPNAKTIAKQLVFFLLLGAIRIATVTWSILFYLFICVLPVFLSGFIWFCSCITCERTASIEWTRLIHMQFLYSLFFFFVCLSAMIWILFSRPHTRTNTHACNTTEFNYYYLIWTLVRPFCYAANNLNDTTAWGTKSKSVVLHHTICFACMRILVL